MKEARYDARGAKIALLIIGVAVLLGGIAFASLPRHGTLSDLPVVGHVPPFALLDQTGTSVRDESLRDTAAAPAQAQPTKTYHAVGVVRSFGPSRSFVNIAHESIPGYMAAMTMSFEPKNPGQLDGLAERDPVQFDFVETADARRVLVQITKRP
jgi:Cu/Ag efflux protein CusF